MKVRKRMKVSSLRPLVALASVFIPLRGPRDRDGIPCANGMDDCAAFRGPHPEVQRREEIELLAQSGLYRDVSEDEKLGTAIDYSRT